MRLVARQDCATASLFSEATRWSWTTEDFAFSEPIPRVTSGKGCSLKRCGRMPRGSFVLLKERADGGVLDALTAQMYVVESPAGSVTTLAFSTHSKLRTPQRSH
jgi:hypothetical protein